MLAPMLASDALSSARVSCVTTFGCPPEGPGTDENCHAGFRRPAAAVAAILRSTASGASRCYMTRPLCIAPHIPSLLLRRGRSLGRRALFANPGLDEKVFNVDDRCAARCAGNRSRF